MRLQCYLRPMLLLLFLISSMAHGTESTTTISVLYFDFEDASDPRLRWVKQGIPDYLSLLFQKSGNFRMVERNRIASLVEEMSLGQMGLINEQDAIEAGKYVGAQFNVFGRVLIPDSASVLILARIVDINTSIVAVTEKVQCKKVNILGVLDELGNNLIAQLQNYLKNPPAQAIESTKTKPVTMPVPASEPLSLKSEMVTVSLSATEHYYQAGYFFGLGKWELAVQEYQEAIRIDPAYVRAYVNLGAVYLQNQMLDLARYNFSMAISLAPESELAHFNLGLYYAHTEDYANAIAEFQKALMLNPNSAEMMVELGKAYYKSGQYREAARMYQRAMALDDHFVSANFYLGVLHRREQNLDSARVQWQKVTLSDEPYFKDVKQLAYKQLGELYMLYQQYELAIPMFQQALAIELKTPSPETHGRIHLDLGKAYLAKKSMPKAAESLREAVELLPGQAEAHFYYGVSLYGLQEMNRATLEFQIAEQLDSNGNFGNSAREYLKKLGH